ncbi:MAG: DUF3987 domain-containing protein [Planctomycetes bacterium]|nr:DUF3987 domain-containing protein [Planctomycetota bacterium]
MTSERQFSLGQGRGSTRATRKSLGDGEWAPALVPHTGRDAWWSPHVWQHDRRRADDWSAASAIVVDVDYYDAAAKHVPPPGDRAQTPIQAASELGATVCHLTPRGARIIWVLREATSDRKSWVRATTALCDSLDEHLAQSGFRVDRGASLDFARIFWTPNAMVDGRQRDAELQVVGEEVDLDDLLPDERDAGLHDVAAAVAAYRAAYPLEVPRSGGTCPLCRHNDCFGRLPTDSSRWFCFSDRHEADSGGVGVRGARGWHGDVLDLHAHARGCSRVECLRQAGYLGANGSDTEAPRGISAECAVSADGGGRFRWPDPRPVVDHQPLPAFPIDTAFPSHLDWLREYVVAIADCFQVPVDAVAMLILPTMGLGLAKRLEVEPQRGWREQLSLYVAVVLPSGERKTAVMRELLAPIYAWQAETASGMANDLRRFENDEQVLKSRLDQARRRAAKIQSDDHPDLDELAGQLATVAATKPRPPSLLVTEGTSEAIARTLVLNQERAMLAAAEGDAIDIMLGRYSGSPNFGVWLAGHSGDSIDSVRRGRGPDRLARPALQVALSVQPDVITGLLASRAAHGRGVLARFFFSLPESKVGFRELQTDPIPAILTDRFGTAMQRNLSAWLPKEPEIIRFSPQAQELFLSYRENNERDLRPDGALSPVRAWGSKLPGGLARVAGILRTFDSPSTREIGVETLQSALSLHHYLVSHYERVAILAGEDPTVEIARRIDAWVRRGRLMSFTRRDAFNQLKNLCARVEDIDPALDLLEERHRIRPSGPVPKPGRGRPPSPRYEVNPGVHGKGDPPSQKSHIPQKSPGKGGAE